MGICWMNFFVQPVFAGQSLENVKSEEEEIKDLREIFEQFTGGKSLDEMLKGENYGEIELKVEKKKAESDFKDRIKIFFKETKNDFWKDTVQFIKNNIFYIFIIIFLYITLKLRKIKQQKRGE